MPEDTDTSKVLEISFLDLIARINSTEAPLELTAKVQADSIATIGQPLSERAKDFAQALGQQMSIRWK